MNDVIEIGWRTRYLRFILPCLVALCFQSSSIALQPAQSSEKGITFRSYRVDDYYSGKPSKITWPSGMDRGDPNLERLVFAVENLLPRKANFAGHYAIVEYGCGTNCGQIAIVDMKTGILLDDGPYGTIDVNLDSKNGPIYKGLSFKARSRLLIAAGCFDWDAPGSAHECGTRYFELRDGRFVLLKFVPGSLLKLPSSSKQGNRGINDESGE